MVTDIAEQVPECLVTLRGASASVGKPPLLLRHGPTLLLAAVGGAMQGADLFWPRLVV